MKAIFPCRFQVDSNDPVFKELEEDMDSRELVDSNFDRDAARDAYIKDNEIYEYQPLLIDMKDIATANPVDKKHTSIRLYTGSGYIVQLSFFKFIAIYQTLTGIVISDFSKEVTRREFDKLLTESDTIEL